MRACTKVYRGKTSLTIVPYLSMAAGSSARCDCRFAVAVTIAGDIFGADYAHTYSRILIDGDAGCLLSAIGIFYRYGVRSGAKIYGCLGDLSVTPVIAIR